MDHHLNQTKLKLRTINVGSRSSQLALIQTKTIINKLTQYYENNPAVFDGLPVVLEFNIVPMTTFGDQILDKALPDIGSKSLFTKELEVALLEGSVDFVVHSLKDLPTTLPEGCAIGAISKRDDPDDTIVVKKSLSSHIKPFELIFNKHDYTKLLGKQRKIGTSSQRRIAMLRHCNSEIECIDIRGNLNTRLSKLDREDSEYAAIILARAGLDRMEWSDRASETLTPKNDSRLNDWCYAVGQGALAVECRIDDEKLLDLLTPIIDMRTTFEAVAERCLMQKLEGGCSIPLGVRTTWSDKLFEDLSLEAIILSLDGKRVVKAHDACLLNDTSISPGYKIKSDCELIKVTTGIILPKQIHTLSTSAKLEMCAALGERVANKMIEAGCLDLMNRSTR